MIIVTSRVCAKQSKSVESFSRPVSAGTQASRPFMTVQPQSFQPCLPECAAIFRVKDYQAGLLKRSPITGLLHLKPDEADNALSPSGVSSQATLPSSRRESASDRVVRTTWR